jgi:ketosteroid isomerase-like protein
MSSIWGSGEHVQCIHPAAGCIAGRTSVLESWKLILGSGRVNISLEDVRVYADESSSGGFVTCVEVVDAGDTRGRIAATNIFEKQKGAWKIVHHHGSAAPRII